MRNSTRDTMDPGRAADRSWAFARLRPGSRGGPIRVTLGELIEAVASVTPDPALRALAVDHILRTRGGRRAWIGIDATSAMRRAPHPG